MTEQQVPNFISDKIEYQLTYRKEDQAFSELESFTNPIDALDRAKELISEGASFYSLVEIHVATMGQVIYGNV